jgi:multidrug resistance efflux pump
MPYNLGEAGAAVGRSKSSILRAIRKGALSAARNETTGEWAIEPAELFRAYPPVAPRSPETNIGTTRHDAETAELREIRVRLEATEARLSDSQDQVADLRRRLDTATGQLGEALSQVRALTDQRVAPLATPRRSWLPWQRG